MDWRGGVVVEIDGAGKHWHILQDIQLVLLPERGRVIIQSHSRLKLATERILPMQFHLRSLFILTAVVSVLCGLIFAAPPIVALPVFCVILWVCPAFWITGIIYGRGAWRPFFIGGVMAGIGPHLAALYYSIMVAISLLGGDGMAELTPPLGGFTNIAMAGMLLGSGPFALLGGWTGMGVYYAFQAPASAALRSPTLPNDDYVVIEGRLTTTPALRSR
jgi:hypothetical protein